MPQDSKPGPTITESFREIQGVFPSDAALQDAIGRLTRAGIDRAALSLPAASPNAASATPGDAADNPNTEDDQRQARTLGSSTAAAAAAMVGAGATVLTGGAAAVAAAAALGAGAAAGGTVAAVTGASNAKETGKRDDKAAAGELVLAVRAEQASEAQVTQAMRDAGASHVATVTRSGAGIV